MTPKQLRVLEFVKRFSRERGFAPTLEEIASFAGVCKVTARQHLQALEKQGLVSRERYGHRSIEIVDDPRERPAGIPLLGRIAAGEPIDAVEVPDTLDVGEMMDIRSGGELFALRVSGDSMIDEGILDGDYVILERRSTAENGQTVVALLEDGTATLKKFYRERSGFRLQPANENLEPIYVKSLTIQGVVKGVFRPV